MAIDNSLYDALENTHTKIQNYLDTTKLGREHSPMMIKQEELSHLLEIFDIEALEEQSTDIDGLHEQLKDIKEISNEILEDLKTDVDSITTTTKVVRGLDVVFLKIAKLVV